MSEYILIMTILFILMLAFYARLNAEDDKWWSDFWQKEYERISDNFLSASDVIRQQKEDIAFLKGKLDDK